MQSGNDAWRPNLCNREVSTPLIRKASVTRTGIGIASFFEVLFGTGVHTHASPAPALLLRTSCFFVPVLCLGTAGLAHVFGTKL